MLLKLLAIKKVQKLLTKNKDIITNAPKKIKGNSTTSLVIIVIKKIL